MLLPLALYAAGILQPLSAGQPQIIRTPFGGMVPSATLFRRTLYVVFGKGSNAFCTRSEDDGDTFSSPVQVNHRPDTVTVGGERGPKLLVTQDGTVHVLWLGDYRKGGGVWYTRSLDGGRSFEPERNLEDRPFGCDGAAIAGNDRGLYAFWLDGRGGDDPQNPVTGTLVMAMSRNNGATWSPSKEVRYDFPGRPCACCRLEVKVGPGDTVTVVFRTGYHNIRDFYVLRSTAGALPQMRSESVSVDDWKLEACPMMGASFIALKDGSSFVAWMTRGRVYWRQLSPRGRSSSKVPAPGSAAQRYPLLAALPQGMRALLWREEGKICWASYSGGAQTPVQRGSFPSAGTHSFDALADAHGRLLILD
ncbi:MAG: sialidase family protein [Chthonomonadales bacterium]